MKKKNHDTLFYFIQRTYILSNKLLCYFIFLAGESSKRKQITNSKKIKCWENNIESILNKNKKKKFFVMNSFRLSITVLFFHQTFVNRIFLNCMQNFVVCRLFCCCYLLDFLLCFPSIFTYWFFDETLIMFVFYSIKFAIKSLLVGFFEKINFLIEIIEIVILAGNWGEWMKLFWI